MKSNKIIELTQAIERKYGSVINAPYNCPELMEANKIALKSDSSRKSLNGKKIEMIKELALKGDSPEEIAEDFNIRVYTVKKIIFQHKWGVKNNDNNF